MGICARASGFKESEANVQVYERDPEPEWQEKLQTEEPVVVLERTRTADDQKVAFYYNIFPRHIAGAHFENGFSGHLRFSSH